MRKPKKTKPKSEAAQHAEFLEIAYAALVIRGFDRERDIADPILRKVWRFGKKLRLKEVNKS